MSKKLPDMAVGSWEAAGVLGIHFTQPAKLGEKGLLTVRKLKSLSAAGVNTFAIYSLAECDKDFLDYEERQSSSGGRPRTRVAERPAMLKKLAAEKHQILFADAIGTHEAADILGVHWTFVSRMAREGKIVGRMLHSDRGRAARLWIFSRVSCEKNLKATKKLEAAGKKPGRKRRA